MEIHNKKMIQYYILLISADYWLALCEGYVLLSEITCSEFLSIILSNFPEGVLSEFRRLGSFTSLESL